MSIIFHKNLLCYLCCKPVILIAVSDLGFTQHEVANGADMNVRTLINIENGHTIPSLLYAMRLANFLNCPVDELFEYKSAGQISNEGDDSNGK